MGKHGPCYHCGVTSTPLWRNGPPEKPVLCNACGSRWRTKGTLANYTPLHARVEYDELEGYGVPKVKAISVKHKEAKIFKRKNDNDVSEWVPSDYNYNQGLYKVFDKDTSNGSSSGSAISNSESYAQYYSAEASDLTGPSNPIVWDATVPSKKRTCVNRSKPSSIEKVTKDLYTIWHEQQLSSVSGSSEEDLLLASNKPMISVEIGHGSVLIQHPSSIAREEESEASSLSTSNKFRSSNPHKLNLPRLMEEAGVNSPSGGIEKMKKPANPWTEQVQIRRDKDRLEKIQILLHHSSPLCHIDLRDIVNFDKFANHFTNEEQQQLLKLLPSTESSGYPHSLKSMFDSPQFKENLSSFQELLSEGVFDDSFSGFNIEEVRDIKKLILSDFKKSKWVEQRQKLKDSKRNDFLKELEAVGGSSVLAAAHSSTVKVSQEGHHPNLSGADSAKKIPVKMSPEPVYNLKEVADNNGSFSSTKHLFSSPNDTSCFTDGSSEHDLLLDVPPNGYLPQAELLFPTSSFGARAATSCSSVYPNLFRI